MFNFLNLSSGKPIKNRVVRTLSNSDSGGRIVSGKKNSKSRFASKSFWIRFLVRFLAICFVGVTAYSLFFSPLLTVKFVDVNGLDSLDRQGIISVVDNILAQKYFNTLNKSNLILANRNEIKKALRDKFKKIENIDIIKEFPDKLSIQIKERESTLVFCSGDSCYVIDRNGRAYAQTDFQSNELDEQKLIRLDDLSQKNILMQDISISADVIDFLKNTQSKLSSDLDIETNKVWSTPILISGDLRAETTEGWKIYFNYNIGATKEIEMLKTVLDNNANKINRADLEYIDLRLDNKVYYKLKTIEFLPAESDK